MFKKTSPQSSLFDPNMIVPGILPADDWSYIYREKIYPLIDEDKFRHLYDEWWGAPNKPPPNKVVDRCSVTEALVAHNAKLKGRLHISNWAQE